MSKRAVTVTIDEEILHDIDRIAEARGDSRSAVMERMIRNALNDELETLEMLGSPVVGAIYSRVLESPDLQRMLFQLIKKEFTEEEIAARSGRVGGLREFGKKLRKERRTGEKGKGSDDE